MRTRTPLSVFSVDLPNSHHNSSSNNSNSAMAYPGMARSQQTVVHQPMQFKSASTTTPTARSRMRVVVVFFLSVVSVFIILATARRSHESLVVDNDGVDVDDGSGRHLQASSSASQRGRSLQFDDNGNPINIDEVSCSAELVVRSATLRRPKEFPCFARLQKDFYNQWERGAPLASPRSNLVNVELDFSNCGMKYCKEFEWMLSELLMMSTTPSQSINQVLNPIDFVSKIDLSNNRLHSHLPIPVLSKMKRLSLLFLTANDFASVPPGLPLLTSVTRLSLKSNHITKVDAARQLPFPGLLHLILTDNKISRISNFGALARLRKLMLSGNEIGASVRDLFKEYCVEDLEKKRQSWAVRYQIPRAGRRGGGRGGGGEEEGQGEEEEDREMQQQRASWMRCTSLSSIELVRLSRNKLQKEHLVKYFYDPDTLNSRLPKLKWLSLAANPATELSWIPQVPVVTKNVKRCFPKSLGGGASGIVVKCKYSDGTAVHSNVVLKFFKSISSDGGERAELAALKTLMHFAGAPPSSHDGDDDGDSIVREHQSHPRRSPSSQDIRKQEDHQPLDADHVAVDDAVVVVADGVDENPLHSPRHGSLSFHGRDRLLLPIGIADFGPEKTDVTIGVCDEFSPDYLHRKSKHNRNNNDNQHQRKRHGNTTTNHDGNDNTNNENDDENDGGAALFGNRRLFNTVPCPSRYAAVFPLLKGHPLAVPPDIWTITQDQYPVALYTRRELWDSHDDDDRQLMLLSASTIHHRQEGGMLQQLNNNKEGKLANLGGAAHQHQQQSSSSDYYYYPLHGRSPKSCLTNVERYRIVRDVVHAAAAMHLAGVVHADIYAHNIFAVAEDGILRGKLMDFGASFSVACDGRDDRPPSSGSSNNDSPSSIDHEHRRIHAPHQHNSNKMFLAVCRPKVPRVFAQIDARAVVVFAEEMSDYRRIPNCRSTYQQRRERDQFLGQAVEQQEHLRRKYDHHHPLHNNEQQQQQHGHQTNSQRQLQPEVLERIAFQKLLEFVQEVKKSDSRQYTVHEMAEMSCFSDHPEINPPP